MPVGHSGEFCGGGGLHASLPALLVTVLPSGQLAVSRRDGIRAPHGFSQWLQARTFASPSSTLHPRHEVL